MKVIRWQGKDVRLALAVEEILMERLEDGPYLLFSVSSPSVVIGRNQVPWRECDLRRIYREGIRFARRGSGGGAVFHDAGNLNYSVIMPRETYRRDRLIKCLIGRLNERGLAVESNKHLALSHRGKKFSGTAFAYRRGAVIHHGTLLVHAELHRMQGLLRGVDTAFQTHAVESAPMPTENLSVWIPSMTMEQGMDIVTDACRDYFGLTGEAWTGPDAADPAVNQRYEERSSHAWLFAQTPAFQCPVDDDLRMCVRDGVIEKTVDASGRTVPDYAYLSGCPLDSSAALKRLASHGAADSPAAEFFRRIDFFTPGPG